MTALVILLLVGIAIYAARRNRRSQPQSHQTPLVHRVAFLERRVVELQTAVDRLLGTAPEPAPEPEPAATPPTPPPAPAPAPPPRVAPQAPVRSTSPLFDWRPTVSAADLMGAKI